MLSECMCLVVFFKQKSAYEVRISDGRSGVCSSVLMPLLLQENYTVRLLELLRQGEIDCAIVALPLPDTGFAIHPLYDEPFLVAVPKHHPWAGRKEIASSALKDETMLLLGSGHCFRDQVLEIGRASCRE